MTKHRTQILVVVGLVLLAVWGLRHAVGVNTALVLGVIIPSIILHELAHGVTALAFGDDTAKKAGRLTLNPIRHVDPVGTLILPGLMALSGLGAFGYAKPVPVNPARMRSPRNHSLVVSLAGPATNIVLALVSVVVLRFARPAGTTEQVRLALTYGFNLLGIGDRLLFLLGFLNVSLAVLNLLPIPPLDGSAVVERVLPARAWPTWLTIRRYAMPLLIVVFLLDSSRLQAIFAPAERLWAHLLGA
ncbi:MAG TPA: site-2 protease family protein [Acidimicrobiales bacterium]|nr:site-2 protease family protein [Acidimicrobiales bacterium]